MNSTELVADVDNDTVISQGLRLIIWPNKKGPKNIKNIHGIEKTEVEEPRNDDFGGRDAWQQWWWRIRGIIINKKQQMQQCICDMTAVVVEMWEDDEGWL